MFGCFSMVFGQKKTGESALLQVKSRKMLQFSGFWLLFSGLAIVLLEWKQKLLIFCLVQIIHRNQHTS